MLLRPLFKVIFRSKDSHVLEITEDAKTEKEAIQKAMNHIYELGWDSYRYEVEEVIKL